jgi:hypothetical protein
MELDEFDIWSISNLNFAGYTMDFLKSMATQTVKNKFELDKKSSLSNSIFRT